MGWTHVWVPQKGQDWGISLQPRDSAGRGGVSSGRVSVAVKLILVGRSTLSADVEAGVLRHATDTARRTGNRRRSGSGRRSCSKRQQHAVHIVCCAAIRHVASFCRSSVTDGGMALTVFPPSCLQSPEGSVNETSPSKAATGANLASRSTPVNGARRAGLALKAPQLVPRNFHSVGKDVLRLEQVAYYVRRASCAQTTSTLPVVGLRRCWGSALFALETTSMGTRFVAMTRRRSRSVLPVCCCSCCFCSRRSLSGGTSTMVFMSCFASCGLEFPGVGLVGEPQNPHQHVDHHGTMVGTMPV